MPAGDARPLPGDGLFAVTTTRVGEEDRLPGRPACTFTGGSLVAGPRREMLARAGLDDAAAHA